MGLLKADNMLAFPNAEVLVPAVEWKYFMDDGEMSTQTPEGRMKTVFKNARRVFETGLKKKVTPYEWGKEVAPGLHAVETHRPHAGPHLVHSVVAAPTRCSSNPTSPIIPRCSSTNPGWHLMFDQDPAQWRRPPAARSTTCWLPTRCGSRASTIRSRRIGNVEKDGSGYRLVPGAVEPGDLTGGSP